MDVYFRCAVEANPAAYKTSWYIGDKEIVQNPSSGVLVSDDHLVIRKVSRKWTGNYTCRASNVVGDTSSNPLFITIRFAPICATEEHEVFEGALGEEVYLPCRVLAYPTNLTFYWTFANSVTQERLSQEWVSWNGLESILRYRSETLQEYGTLHCWAANSAGQQEIPCTLTFRPAGAPAPPSNCSVSNQTWDTLEVTCLPPKIGYSRFIAQGSKETITRTGSKNKPKENKGFKTDRWTKSDDILFLLTVYERSSMAIVYNQTGVDGVFLIKGLSSGLDYLITVSRFNARGRSSEITLEALTLRAAENRMRNNLIPEPKAEPLNGWFATTIGAASGAAVALISMLVALVYILRRGNGRRDRERPGRGGGTGKRGREDEELNQDKERENIQLQAEPPDILEPKTTPYVAGEPSHSNILDHDKKPQTDTTIKGRSNSGSPSSRSFPPSQLQARDLQAQLQSLPQSHLASYAASSIHTLPRSKSGLEYGVAFPELENRPSKTFIDSGFTSLNRPTLKPEQKYSYVKHGDPQIERESFL